MPDENLCVPSEKKKRVFPFAFLILIEWGKQGVRVGGLCFGSNLVMYSDYMKSI